MTLLKRFQKVNSFESIILKDLSEKVAILYPNIDGVSNSCNCREKGITNKDFVSTFGKIIKNITLKEVHKYFIEILGTNSTLAKTKDIIMNLERLINETNCSIAKDCMASFFICLSLSIFSKCCHSCTYLIKY
jgi:hypothetical protein